MTGMTLELHTFTIQRLLISLVTTEAYRPESIPADVLEEMEQVLIELNRMCSPENNYTLTVEVSA